VGVGMLVGVCTCVGVSVCMCKFISVCDGVCTRERESVYRITLQVRYSKNTGISAAAAKP